MDLDLTSDQELLRETTARFIQDTCPLTTVRERADSGARTDPAYVRQAAELGWFALLVPEDHGGGSVSGEGVRDAALVAEERGRVLQPGAFVATNVVAWALATAGTEEQRAKVLPALVAGESVATWACADATGDWSATAGVTATTSAGGFVLSGTKSLVIDADVADWLLVSAATERGASQFLIPAATAKVTITPMEGLDITRRFCRVDFDGAEIPADSLVGGDGEAAPLLDRQRQLAVVLTVAESVGAMDAIFEQTVDYAKSRIAFGRPIGSFQAVKHLLADTALLLETSKAASVAATRAVQAGDEDADEVASMAKAYVGESGITLAQNCFQVFGGIGFTWEHDMHLYMRRLTADAALYGEPAWHREHVCRIHGL